LARLSRQSTGGDDDPLPLPRPEARNASTPSRQSLRGLDWFIFFLADVQTGFGPFIAVYLTTEKWTQAEIGLVLSIGGVVGLVGQMPGGAIVDAARSERLVAGFAIAAIGDDLDHAPRRLEGEPRLWLLHRQNAAVEQDGRDADRIRSGHRRRVLRLHDDETHLRARILRRDEQVEVAKHAATRLVEQEIPQSFIAGDEPRLLPQRLARRRRDPADDDIADLLARQVSLPVLFAQAMTKAAQDADLIVTAGPDAALAATAAACCGLPAVAVPARAEGGLGGSYGADPAMSATMIAAMFAAGAITDLLPFLAPSGPADTPASPAIPRMRMGEPAESQAPQGSGGHAEDDDVDRTNTVRSGRII